MITCVPLAFSVYENNAVDLCKEFVFKLSDLLECQLQRDALLSWYRKRDAEEEARRRDASLEGFRIRSRSRSSRRRAYA